MHPKDEHTGDSMRLDDRKAFAAELEGAWKSEGAALLNEKEQSLARLKHSEDLLPLYRFVNHPDYLRALTLANIVGPTKSSSAQC